MPQGSFLGSFASKNAFAGGAPPAIPQIPELVVRGLDVPSPRTSPLLSAFGIEFRPLASIVPPRDKLVARPTCMVRYNECTTCS